MVAAEEDLEYKIEIATQTLERNIDFVTNCDNKTSIVLAAFGVLLAIILRNEVLNEIFNIVKACIATKTFCSILYLLCFIGAIFIMVLGYTLATLQHALHKKSINISLTSIKVIFAKGLSFIAPNLDKSPRRCFIVFFE